MCENSGLLEADPDMVALVKGLIGDGYSVGILSNIPTTLAGQVRKKQTWLEDCAAVTLAAILAWPSRTQRPIVWPWMRSPRSRKIRTFDDRVDYVEGASYCGLNAHLFRGIDSVREVLSTLE